MPKILRKIDKANWLVPEDCPSGEVPGDVLRDLCPKDNRLSVWVIEDDTVNLNRILAALASTRDYVTQIDYILFPLEVLEQAGIESKPSAGVTLDAEANKKWHRDLVNLSVSRLAALATALMSNDTSIKKVRRREKDVLQDLEDAVKAGWISGSDLKPKVQAKLGFTDENKRGNFMGSASNQDTA